jgi:hypothetical protein
MVPGICGISNVFAKITDNLECYVKSLEKNEIKEIA